MFERKGATLDQIDPEIFAAIENKNRRQEDHIELIASENYTSPAVMAAQGSQLTNKYAEGFRGKRYYRGEWRFGRPDHAPGAARALAEAGAGPRPRKSPGPSREGQVARA